jgi:hypothetical protein
MITTKWNHDKWIPPKSPTFKSSVAAMISEATMEPIKTP